jgi:hypothetical protein
MIFSLVSYILTVLGFFLGMIDNSSAPKSNLFFIEFSQLLLKQFHELPLKDLLLKYLEKEIQDFISFQIIQQFQLKIFQEFFHDFIENIQFLLQTLELLKENIFNENPGIYSLSFQQLKNYFSVKGSHYSSKKAFIKDKHLEVLDEEVVIPLDDDENEESNSENVLKTTNYHLLEEFLNDFFQWLNNIFENYFHLIQFSKEWNGVLMIDLDNDNENDEFQEFLFPSKDITRKQ